jgi:hypothetical protein
MLASGVTRVSHWYVLRGEQPGDDDVAEVLVSGPHAEPTPSAPDVRAAERAAGSTSKSRVAEAVVSIR